MNPLIANIITRGSVSDWYIFPFFLTIIVGTFAVRYWPLFVQRLNGIRGRDWPTISAIVDVVSVVKQTEQARYGERTIGYLATLTYFYRNPELQVGEHSRIFVEEADAQSWAASYKDSAIMVHLDPRDPSRSVLRKEEL